MLGFDKGARIGGKAVEAGLEMIDGKGFAQEFGDAGVAGRGNAGGVGRRGHHDHRGEAVWGIGAGAQAPD
ncbi:hypothetical protein D3C86_2241260 [compost metagenome]